jgi:hypothetical protein
MTYLRLTGFLLALALAAGCGGGDEEAAPATTGAERASVPEWCIAANASLTAPLGGGMKEETFRLKNAQAVQSEDRDGIYFVSAEMYGEGVEAGTVGTWATTSLGGAEAIWTVDEVSKQYSDFRDGTQVADLSMNDHGAQESRDCVEAVR